MLFHPISFLLRRLVLVYLVVAGTEHLVYQMMILMGSTIVSAIIVYRTEAFQLPLDRRLSTFSELVTLLVSYCFFSFDLLDVDSNFLVGYVPIGFMAVFLLASILIILFSSIRKLKMKVKLCCTKRQYRRQRRYL